MQQLIKQGECEHCKINQIMDQDLISIRDSLTRRILRIQSLQKIKLTNLIDQEQRLFNIDDINCQVVPCAIEMKVDTSAKIYNEIDLREAELLTTAKQQGGCGSCWCFATTAIMESAILSDQTRGLPQNKPFWTFNHNNLSLSEQFIMSNLWGFQRYCNGGNFITAVAGITQNFSTVELEQNFPYDYMNKYKQWQNETQLPPIIKSEDYYLPMQKFLNQIGQTQIYVSAFYIYDGESSIFNDKNSVMLAKQFLSRGIPIAGVMYAPDSLQYYDGTTVLKGQCFLNRINHQITITGYGRKNNQYVWIVRNSWSNQWGSDGYFYIRQGYNDYCIETSFFTMIPANFPVDDFANQLIKQENIIQTNRGQSKYLDQQTIQIVNAQEAYNISDQPNTQTIILAMSVSVCVAILVGVGVYLIIRSRKHRHSGSDTQQLDSNPQYNPA